MASFSAADVLEPLAGGPNVTSSGASPQLDEQNPWPGLAAYDEASQKFFYGREDDAVELLRLIRLAPLTALYGKSGLGKTSLLQAGLFPKLRLERYLPVWLRVDFSDDAGVAPLEQAAQRLAEEIEQTGADCPPRAPGEDLWEYLHRRDLEIWSDKNFPLTPVLVFDQCEELVSRSGGNRERISSVFDVLADLIENRIPAELASDASRERLSRLDLNAQRYRIVLAFREDFLPEFETWKDKVPSLLRSRLRLLPMSRAQAISATERAGAAVLAQGVAAQIVDFVANREAGARGPEAEVEPVLLSLCCTQLNRRRPAGSRIDVALVASAAQDILESFYDEALEGLPERVPQFIESNLIQGDRYRGSFPRDAAIERGDLTIEELRALTDTHRLLRIDQQRGVARIELIHDRLVGVVARSRNERAAREREQQLIAEARAAKNLRRLTSFLAIALLLAGSAAAAAVWKWRQADEASIVAEHSEAIARKLLQVAGLAAEEADKQRRLANERLQRITDVLAMKQALLSGDQDRIAAYLAWAANRSTLRFTARAENLHRKGASHPFYKFSLMPEPSDLAKANKSVAVITYLLNHETFQQSLNATGVERSFVASYVGWGCLENVIVLIEYKEPDHPAEIAEYDMCRALGWQ